MSIRVQTLTRSAISGLSMLLACFLALAYFVVSQGASQAATVNDIVKDVKLCWSQLLNEAWRWHHDAG